MPLASGGRGYEKEYSLEIDLRFWAGAPILSADCGGITTTGCCDELTLQYCASDFVFTENCLDSCGWNPISLYYECGFEGEAPNGEHPKKCPGSPSGGEGGGGESPGEGGESRGWRQLR